MLNKYRQHQNFEARVMLAYQTRYPHARLWQSPTGNCYALYSVINAFKVLMKTRSIVAAKKALIRVVYGKVGQGDITGINLGRFVSIEIKTGRSIQSTDQKNFQKMIEDRGGQYLVVRDSIPIEDQI